MLIWLCSCGNELDTITYSNPVPVVYGAVCPQDSIHRIKLNRSFITDRNIEENASKYDSVFYPEAKIFLEARSSSGDVIQRFEMVQKELPPRDIGIFISEPNLVYECSTNDLIDPLDKVEGLKYALTILLPGEPESIFAECMVPPLPEFRFIEPKPGSKPYELQLFDYEIPIFFSWPRSMKYYLEFETHVNILEMRNGEWEKSEVIHSMKFNRWDREPIEQYEKVVIRGGWFCSVIGGSIKNDPEVTLRKFESIDFILKTSDPMFYDYFEYGHQTTDLYTNIFTNVIGGIGIFVAFNRLKWEGYTVNQRVLDSLANGRYTKHLHFSRWD